MSTICRSGSPTSPWPSGCCFQQSRRNHLFLLLLSHHRSLTKLSRVILHPSLVAFSHLPSWPQKLKRLRWMKLNIRRRWPLVHLRSFTLILIRRKDPNRPVLSVPVPVIVFSCARVGVVSTWHKESNPSMTRIDATIVAATGMWPKTAPQNSSAEFLAAAPSTTLLFTDVGRLPMER